MTSEPQVKSLSHHRRKIFFWGLVLVFLVALPSVIFYTTGYRLNFENDETTIVTTGGMYVTTDNLEVDVYLDQEQVQRPRLFRSAYYIQNIKTGQHRIVVQRPDLYTWVKELPVDPYMVVEASAFNMPLVPQVRPITKYVTATGTPVYLGVSSTTELFIKATTTVAVLATSSNKIGDYKINNEFNFIDSLFKATSTHSVFEKNMDSVKRFSFATTSPRADSKQATTTTKKIVEKGDLKIVERDGELYAVWQDTVNTIPYYFCIVDTGDATDIAMRYGEHVAKEIERLEMSTSTAMMSDDKRVCRPEVKLDRQNQDVYFYGFFPNNSDLVLLQLEDGLYVTEIDDRSWQNSQLLYPGSDLLVIIENNTIYVQDEGKYFEVITKIEPN